MIYDRFVFLVCIVSLILSGVFSSLIFQGLDFVMFLSILSNLATIGGFFFAVYAFNIWKKQRKLEFIHHEIMHLQKSIVECSSFLGQARAYAINKQKVFFIEALQKAFTLDKTIRDVTSTIEINSHLALDNLLGSNSEIEKYQDFILLLRSLVIAERQFNDSELSDFDIIYSSVSGREDCPNHRTQLRSIFMRQNVNFKQMNMEVGKFGNAL
jgi:hypothetical protein